MRSDTAGATWNRLQVAACVTLLLLVGFVTTAATASAACAAPTLSTGSGNVEPAGTVMVSGEEWRSSCDDTQSQVVGESPSPQPAPAPDTVLLSFVQNGVTTPLKHVDADDAYAFQAEVVIPTTAKPGPAELLAEGRPGASATSPITVVGSTALKTPPTAPAGPGGTSTPTALPLTGASVPFVLALGLGLAAGGGALALIGRPRAASPNLKSVSSPP